MRALRSCHCRGAQWSSAIVCGKGGEGGSSSQPPNSCPAVSLHELCGPLCSQTTPSLPWVLGCQGPAAYQAELSHAACPLLAPLLPTPVGRASVCAQSQQHARTHARTLPCRWWCASGPRCRASCGAGCCACPTSARRTWMPRGGSPPSRRTCPRCCR